MNSNHMPASGSVSAPITEKLIKALNGFKFINLTNHHRTEVRLVDHELWLFEESKQQRSHDDNTLVTVHTPVRQLTIRDAERLYIHPSLTALDR